MGPKKRLQNEIAALQFLGSHPKIPTPELLFHSVTSKHVCLVTDAIDGVHVRDLQDLEDFRSACAEIDEIKERLGDIVRQNAGSFIGDVFFNEVMSCTLNKRKVKIFDDDTIHGYPLCHGDLYASNIIVDPMSGRVKALIDWEYAGYFPAILDPPCFLTERKDVGQAALQAYKDGLAAFCSAYRQAHHIE
jgi:aminoglycoside phosphotransferase